MNRFEMITPTDLAHAARLLREPGHVAIAGSVDVIDLLKQNLAEPAALVNLKGLKELDGIASGADGTLRLGALTRLSEVSEHPRIRERFAAIAQAASQAATPQIRNLGTVGGNLLQRPRCWYFRNPDTRCLKKGGDKCYALGGLNRYHAILGGGPSYIVHPSNLAPALIAFDARARIVGPDGERTVDLEKFFTLPTVDAERENDLKPGEIVVEVTVPSPSPDARSIYLEAREKQSFDWPLVSVAALVSLAGNKTVRDSRVVMGAVAPVPWRSREAESALRGGTLDRARAAAAAAAALKQAQPMSDNMYKVPIAKTLVRRAILQAAGIENPAAG
jgi:xanthine dehydrogenase YagS FAD-binding subunit